MSDVNIGSAYAQPNIALIKYWGKRDATLNLPYSNSIGITLDQPGVHTTIRFSRFYKRDSYSINGRRFHEGSANFAPHMRGFLAAIRSKIGSTAKAHITSISAVPVAAGLASSAAAYAALTVAANAALSMNLSERELSTLARIGSGSAARSVGGGFVEWMAGSAANGEDSIAESLYDDAHWPELRMLICVTDDSAKTRTSREGMRLSQKTSPYFPTWLTENARDLTSARQAIQRRDLEQLGTIAEHNCLKMHAVMLSSRPALFYLNGASIELMRMTETWRRQGILCYFTIDAGCQLKFLCEQSALPTLREQLKATGYARTLYECSPGRGARTTILHLQGDNDENTKL